MIWDFLLIPVILVAEIAGVYFIVKISDYSDAMSEPFGDYPEVPHE